jgi:hypothetical protein
LKSRAIILALVLLLTGCNLPLSKTAPAKTIVALPSPVESAASPATGAADQSGEPTLESSPSAAGTLPAEAILILEPGPGSRLTSPVWIAGVADPAFEQTLGVSIVLADGTVLAIGSVRMEAEAGQRGNFTVDVPFDIEGERQAFIQVFASSPRDGGITHLNSVGVTLTSSGTADIKLVEPYAERIMIRTPNPAAQIQGGVVHVEGFGLASFEQTLLVEVQDGSGRVVGSSPVIVTAPDLGQPGPFSADISYTVSEPGSGRIVVRDISPAYGGNTHLASVEISLLP